MDAHKINKKRFSSTVLLVPVNTVLSPSSYIRVHFLHTRRNHSVAVLLKFLVVLSLPVRRIYTNLYARNTVRLRCIPRGSNTTYRTVNNRVKVEHLNAKNKYSLPYNNLVRK